MSTSVPSSSDGEDVQRIIHRIAEDDAYRREVLADFKKALPLSLDGRELVAALAERIATDPGFRQQVLDDPASVLAEIHGQTPDPVEVEGYRWDPGCGPIRTCYCTGGTAHCQKTDRY